MKTTTKRTDSPNIDLAAAEKVIRDIAKRNGNGLKKRRAKWAKDHFGDGYMLFELRTNTCLDGGHGPANDGCNATLADLARRFQKDKKNTPWQNIVIQSIIANKISADRPNA